MILQISWKEAIEMIYWKRKCRVRMVQVERFRYEGYRQCTAMTGLDRNVLQ